MKMVIAWLSVTVVLVAGPAYAQTAGPLPQFQVDPFWPKPLPNNWILGQVSGIATDKSDRIWVVHRPGSLTPRERAAEQNPPEAKCCIAAPPVLVFDQSGNLIRHWGGSGSGYEWPESEHGIFIDDNDFVWLAGNGKKDGQLLKFTMDGKFVLQIGKQGQGNDSNSTERLGSPADVAVELYHGPTAGGHELLRGAVVRMRLAGNGLAQGLYRFTGEIPTKDSGAHAFAARVMPWNASMSHPYETSLVRWA